MHSSGLAVFIDFIGKIKNFFQFFVISLKYQKSKRKVHKSVRA